MMAIQRRPTSEVDIEDIAPAAQDIKIDVRNAHRLTQ